MKKEIIYTMPYETKNDIKKAEKLQTELYAKYKNVQIYPNGFYEICIIVENELIKKWTSIKQYPGAGQKDKVFIKQSLFYLSVPVG